MIVHHCIELANNLMMKLVLDRVICLGTCTIIDNFLTDLCSMTQTKRSSRFEVHLLPKEFDIHIVLSSITQMVHPVVASFFSDAKFDEG